ncbi:MAG: 50S ribosomal protein L16 [Phycisphaerae bacterium]
MPANMPKRVKYRKSQKGRNRGNASSGNFVAYGEYGLQALDAGRVNARHIEAGRIAAQHFLQREGRVFIRVFPHKPISSKPLETRMGKGKGEPDYWTSLVKPGTIMYEISGVPKEVARVAMLRISHKMPVRTRFVERVQSY